MPTWVLNPRSRRSIAGFTITDESGQQIIFDDPEEGPPPEGSFVEFSFGYSFNSGESRIEFNWDWDEGVIDPPEEYFGPPDHYYIEHFFEDVLIYTEDDIPGVSESWSVPYVDHAYGHKVIIHARRADDSDIDTYESPTMGPD